MSVNEPKLLQRAKEYMDKLALGINPIDGTMVSEGDIVNNVRVTRCFLYISEVLGKLIENGGTELKYTSAPQQKRVRLPFELPFEYRMRFPYSDYPLTQTNIAEQITLLANEALLEKSSNEENLCYTMKRLPGARISEWLIEIGLMYEDTRDGKSRKRPTEQGEKIGISTLQKVSQQGTPYSIVVFNREAQQFIIDNLDAVIAKHNAPKKNRENVGQPWTKAEEEILTDMFSKSIPEKDIADHLMKTPGAIKKRLVYLGLVKE